jgi:Zn-dependent peptidase ImmA (M78 family)
MVSVDFKVVGTDNRGIYYHDSKRAIIYLNKHESLEDIIKTIQHEMVHHCINIHGIEMDEDEEESLIYQMAWAELSIN